MKESKNDYDTHDTPYLAGLYRTFHGVAVLRSNSIHRVIDLRYNTIRYNKIQYDRKEDASTYLREKLIKGIQSYMRCMLRGKKDKGLKNKTDADCGRK